MDKISLKSWRQFVWLFLELKKDKEIGKNLEIDIICEEQIYLNLPKQKFQISFYNFATDMFGFTIEDLNSERVRIIDFKSAIGVFAFIKKELELKNAKIQK